MMTHRVMSRRRGAVAVVARLPAVLAGVLLAAGAQAADTVWSLAANLEGALPLTEEKVEQALGESVRRTEQGTPARTVYRAEGIWLKDRNYVEALVWTPQSGTTPASVTIVLPLAPARPEDCLTRAQVSRQYGAPVRSWNTKEGDQSLTHFEFAQPAARVSVAFSDTRDCLRTLTVTEAR